MKTNETRFQSFEQKDINEKEMGTANQAVHVNQNLPLSSEDLNEVFYKISSKMKKGEFAIGKDSKIIESELSKIKTREEYHAYVKSLSTEAVQSPPSIDVGKS